MSQQGMHQCSRCSFVQEYRFTHCGQCGQSLYHSCPRCTQLSPPNFRNCGFCGVFLFGPLQGQYPPGAQPMMNQPMMNQAFYPPMQPMMGQMNQMGQMMQPMMQMPVMPNAMPGSMPNPLPQAMAQITPEQQQMQAQLAQMQQQMQQQMMQMQAQQLEQAQRQQLEQMQQAQMQSQASAQAPSSAAPSAVSPVGSPDVQAAAPSQSADQMPAASPANVAPPDVSATPSDTPPAAPTQAVTPTLPPTPARSNEPLAQSAVARVSERRLVAVLFCDICGFTAMSESLDPEEVSNIIQPLFQKCNQIISKFGGVIEKFIGDALMALFGVPMAHEDDADRAALAALEIRDCVQEYAAELMQTRGFSLNMRIGLNVGTVVAGSVESGEGKNYQVMGDVINTAARMEQNATPGHILATEDMYRLIKDSFEMVLAKEITAKGKTEPIKCFEVVGIRRLQQALRGFEHKAIPMLGREDELACLKARGKIAFEQSQPDFVLITGDSGLGKSRLAQEGYQALRKEDNRLRLIQGNSTSYSKNFSYFMLQNLLRSMLEVDESTPHAEVQERIKSFLKTNNVPNQGMIASLLEYVLYPHLEIQQLKLIAPERLQQQIFKAFSDTISFYCQQQPLYVLIDDLQWCDPPSLAWLVQYQAIAKKRALPIFFCFTSRLAQIEDSADPSLTWQQHLPLEPLENTHCEHLIALILGLEHAPANLKDLVEAILSRANGNPYYIEEVLKNLLDDKLLAESQGSWRLTCSLRDLPLPGSVQRLIMTRFDRLPEYQRHLLQCLSAIGEHAPLHLIEVLLADKLQHLEGDLAALVETHFVYRKQGRETEYVFYQALTQEVIYNTMVNRRKRALHQQIGEAIEALNATDPSQVLDLLAYHFSRTQEDKKAVRYLNLSALKAARLYANTQALEQYAQILELLQNMEPQVLISTDLHKKEWQRVGQLRHEVVQRQCEIMLMTGNYEEVLNLANSTLEKSELSPVERARLLYSKGRVLEKRSDFPSARSLYEEAQALVETQTDLQMQARMWNAIGWVSRWMNEYDKALTACQKALELLEMSPDMEQIAYAHNVIGVAHHYLHDWEKSLAHYRQSLEIQEQIQDLWGQANSLSNIGNVYFMTNRWEESVRVFQESLTLREQLGDLEGISHSCNNLGHAFQELGRFDEAEKVIRQALGLYRQLENQLGIAVAQCNLGTICYRRGQWNEALELLNPGIDFLEKRKLESMLAEAYNHRIEILIASNMLDGAGDAFAKNSEAIQTHGDPVQQGRLERLRGKYLLLRNDKELGLEALNRALELLQPTAHPAECQALYTELATFHKSIDSPEASYWEEMCAAGAPVASEI